MSRNKWKERQEEKRKEEAAKITMATAKELKTAAVKKVQKAEQRIAQEPKPKAKTLQNDVKIQPMAHPQIKNSAIRKEEAKPSEKQMTIKKAAKRKTSKGSNSPSSAKAGVKRKSKK